MNLGPKTPQRKSKSTKDTIDFESLEERQTAFKSNHCLLKVTMTGNKIIENAKNQRLIHAFLVESVESDLSLRAEEVYIHETFDQKDIELLMLFIFEDNIPPTGLSEMKAQLGFMTFKDTILGYESKAKTGSSKGGEFS